MNERRTAERRRAWLAIHFPDRRHGFPRRAPESGLKSRYYAGLAAIRDNSTLVVLLAALLLALNIADLALTKRALAAGAIEVNPVMAALFDTSTALAAAAKLWLSALVVAGLWALRRYRSALAMMIWACVAMGALVAYQTLLVAAIT